MVLRTEKLYLQELWVGAGAPGVHSVFQMHEDSSVRVQGLPSTGHDNTEKVHWQDNFGSL